MYQNKQSKFLLEENRIPRQWYNIAADLPIPVPTPVHPVTREPVHIADLEEIFPRAIIEQEMATERFIEIPAPVLDVLRQWRPAPLMRAHALEKALDTCARIYYKYEGVSPAGSHKPNSAVPQAWYNAQAGIRRLTTETGAGQWGSSLAYAGQLFGLDVTVFQVRVSYEQKPYRRALMETYGARCISSPSNLTEAGRRILAEQPDHVGALGIAISEAVEIAAQNPDTCYALGSVLNHVALHQTIIGQEAILQMEMADDDPDIVIACAGGGSNFAGMVFPFVGQELRRDITRRRRYIAAEPSACPTLTRGRYALDYGDTSHLTPLLRMYTLGASFTPPGLHAGGLRYHGMSPLVSLLLENGMIEARGYDQTHCFEAGVLFARCEGIVPAPESNHAIRAAIDEALKCREEGTPRSILFNLSGHGHFDMAAYQQYLDGKLVDVPYDEQALADALARLP